ncbi:fibronectin type III domain-containing protein [Flavobacterium sp. 3HN19-14]|uniref:fibronectin type III domain-containing protein n=1 Tax=Flavobacterium sp. 3HN19-14 TaxID=3448133 RepID=UPI003EE18F8D
MFRGTTQSIGYTFVLQYENCSPKPTAGTATAIELNQATLGWTSTADFSSWQVAVQDLGAAIPSNTGTYDYITGTTSYTKTGLVPAHQYQFWVRAECVPGSGIYTAWAVTVLFRYFDMRPDQCMSAYFPNDRFG